MLDKTVIREKTRRSNEKADSVTDRGLVAIQKSKYSTPIIIVIIIALIGFGAYLAS